jgi:hypothetical protein
MNKPILKFNLKRVSALLIALLFSTILYAQSGVVAARKGAWHVKISLNAFSLACGRCYHRTIGGLCGAVITLTTGLTTLFGASLSA